jgi:hypothetical protein
VTVVNDRTRLVVVTVAPANALVGPDTVIIERSWGAGSNPLNLP